MTNDITEVYKLVVLGDSGVGKSCIMSMYNKNYFNDFNESTIGAAFSTSIIEIKKRKVKLEMWDTAGQERFKSLAPMYYRGSKFAVIVFDITSKKSFNGAKKWIKQLITICGDSCSYILVGNKIDLEDRRQVLKQESKKFSEEKNILYIEVSAKTGENIENIFYDLVRNSIPREIKNDTTNVIINDKYVKIYSRTLSI